MMRIDGPISEFCGEKRREGARDGQFGMIEPAETTAEAPTTLSGEAQSEGRMGLWMEESGEIGGRGEREVWRVL